MREKEKMLVTSIFSFARNVLKSLLVQSHEKRDCLLSKGSLPSNRILDLFRLKIFADDI